MILEVLEVVRLQDVFDKLTKIKPSFLILLEKKGQTGQKHPKIPVLKKKSNQNEFT